MEEKGGFEERKEKYRELREQQQTSTKEIRNWHIKSFWRWGWKGEMEAYEEQVKKDEEQRKAAVQDLDESLKEVEGELLDVEKQVQKTQEVITELKSKDSEKWVDTVLASEGLLDLEAEVREKDEILKTLRRQFAELLHKTGLANPDEAANLVTQHEKSRVLVFRASEASTDVSVTMKMMEKTISRVTMDPMGMEDVALSLDFVQRKHKNQNEHLKRNQHEVLKKEWDLLSATEASLLVAPESNQTNN